MHIVGRTDFEHRLYRDFLQLSRIGDIDTRAFLLGNQIDLDANQPDRRSGASSVILRSDEPGMIRFWLETYNDRGLSLVNYSRAVIRFGRARLYAIRDIHVATAFFRYRQPLLKIRDSQGLFTPKYTRHFGTRKNLEALVTERVIARRNHS